MKNGFTRATVFVGGAAVVAAFALQGCQTYDPYAPREERTIFGRGEQDRSGTVQVAKPVRETAATGTRQVVQVPVAEHPQPAPQAGDYTGMVLPEGAEPQNPYEGITRTSRRHVPTPPPAQAAEAAPAVTADGKYAIYVVKSGDSAGHIANRHGMTRAEFVKVNNLSNPNLIKVGQKVKVLAGGKPLAAGAATASASAASGSQYTVVAGDTLGGIAHRYKVKTADLMAANGISDANKIRVGQKLVIPGAKTAPAKAATAAPAPKAPSAPAIKEPGEEPLVQPIQGPAPDETLDSLIEQAMTGNASLLEIKQKEAADAAAAMPPTPVTAPAAGDGVKLYTVQEGEDLYTVAGKFQASPMSIRRLNNITGSAIPAGTVIKIPAAGK